MRNETFSNNLLSSISSSELSSVFVDIAEIGLDSLLEDGLGKELPIVGWFLKLPLAYKNISDRILLKKILLFLKEVSEIDLDKREKFMSEMGNENYRNYIGENLLLLIDKHERFEKSSILGQLFQLLANQAIDKVKFYKLSSVLNRVDVEDLKVFIKEKNNFDNIPIETKEGLYRSGICKIHISSLSIGNYIPNPTTISYKVDELGEIFSKYIKI
jgi:hypothetical protein